MYHCWTHPPLCSWSFSHTSAARRARRRCLPRPMAIGEQALRALLLRMCLSARPRCSAPSGARFCICGVCCRLGNRRNALPRPALRSPKVLVREVVRRQFLLNWRMRTFYIGQSRLVLAARLCVQQPMLAPCLQNVSNWHDTCALAVNRRVGLASVPTATQHQSTPRPVQRAWCRRPSWA